MVDINCRAYYNRELLYNAARVGNALYWDNGNCFDLLAFKQSIPPIMMRSSTLFDKNNVQIYEYDLVNLFGGDEPVVVVQHLGASGYFVYNDFVPFANNLYFKWDDDKSDRVEVVGTIYNEFVNDARGD